MVHVPTVSPILAMFGSLSVIDTVFFVSSSYE
jgi:hypothetical protein